MKWYTFASILLIVVLSTFTVLYIVKPRVVTITVTKPEIVTIIEHLPSPIVYVHKPVPPDTVYLTSSPNPSAYPDSLLMARKTFRDMLLSPKTNVDLVTITSVVTAFSVAPVLFLGDSIAIAINKEAILAEYGQTSEAHSATVTGQNHFWVPYLLGVASLAIPIITAYILLD